MTSLVAFAPGVCREGYGGAQEGLDGAGGKQPNCVRGLEGRRGSKKFLEVHGGVGRRHVEKEKSGHSAALSGGEAPTTNLSQPSTVI